MANIEVLNFEQHAEVLIQSKFVDSLGYNTGVVSILPNEIQSLQREFPIVFRKNPETGDLILNAMLGFEPDQNLFLTDSGVWGADYVPLAFAKGPFLMGPINTPEGGEKIAFFIDSEDPRVNKDAGEKIFDEQGELTEYMESVRQSLHVVREGAQFSNDMVQEFNKAELIEPLSLDMKFESGEQITLDGAYTISHEKIQQLTAEQLHTLNVKGYLELAFYIASSLSNVQRLVNLKNAKNS
ncbi:MAG: hypothetical protein ACI93R_002908 [Flavobacteriales bacterium]|jgi:hypothetical protein